MSEDPQGNDRRRIEALEQVVRSLVQQVNDLRAELRSSRSAAIPSWDLPGAPPVPPPPTAAEPLATGVAPAAERSAASTGAAPTPAVALPPAASWSSSLPPMRPRPPKPEESLDFENLVGRYGTLAVATLAILLGLGAFLQWAIARNLLGPEVRVGLGALAAAVLTGVGLRMREGSPKFSSALLAIALAVVHLDAWAAGPLLALVPPSVALGIAAIASALLSALALRDGEQFLFCLGLGGAMLAPFITMPGAGDSSQLLVYGFVVLTAAIVAIREPEWLAARWLLSTAAMWYALAAGWEGHAPTVYWPALFALLLAAVTVAVGAAGVRRTLVGSLVVVLCATLLQAGDRDGTTLQKTVAYAFTGTLLLHALRRRTAAAGDGGESSAEPVWLPFLLLLTSLIPADLLDERRGTMVAALWAALSALYVFVDPPRHRGRHLAAVLNAALIGVLGLSDPPSAAAAVGMAALAATAALAMSRLGGRILFLPLGLALLFATVFGYRELDLRVAYAYTPFLSLASAAAFAVVLAWLAVSRLLPPPLRSQPESSRPGDHLAARLVAAAGPVVAFLWVREELSAVVSRDLSMFLLIIYYAVAGVGTLLYGRMRQMTATRQVGLALALYAAFKAFLEANDLRQIGLRVGSLLVVGVFILGVGYLYRVRKDEGAAA